MFCPHQSGKISNGLTDKLIFPEKKWKIENTHAMHYEIIR